MDDPGTGLGELGLLSDAGADDISDNDDVFAAALAYVRTRPYYRSVYYASGYPDNEYGVYTDVGAIACRAAGYDLQTLMSADIAHRPGAYAIEMPGPAIDFRRTSNLRVFLDTHAQSLITDVGEISEWRASAFVLYDGHIGIVSDRRNAEGVPYLIHHFGPLQFRYEEGELGGLRVHRRSLPTTSRWTTPQCAAWMRRVMRDCLWHRLRPGSTTCPEGSTYAATRAWSRTSPPAPGLT